jgi:hypothetical protein
MQSQHRLITYLIATITFSALAGGIALTSALLGAPAGAIVLGEMSALACVVAFTLLIWGAIEDGKEPRETAAD